MPTNLYGPGDNFDLQNSHVLPALIRRFHEAKLRGDREVVDLGHRLAAPGVPARRRPREDALVHLMESYDAEELVNIGWGEDLTIRELADSLREVVGFKGALTFDPSKPDGTPRKLLDVTRLSSLGWRPTIGLREGLASTYRWYLDHAAEART